MNSLCCAFSMRLPGKPRSPNRWARAICNQDFLLARFPQSLPVCSGRMLKVRAPQCGITCSSPSLTEVVVFASTLKVTRRSGPSMVVIVLYRHDCPGCAPMEEGPCATHQSESANLPSLTDENSGNVD